MLTADAVPSTSLSIEETHGQDTTIDEPRALAKSLIESLNGPQDAAYLTSIWDLSVRYQNKTQDILRDAHKSLSRMYFFMFDL